MKKLYQLTEYLDDTYGHSPFFLLLPGFLDADSVT